MKCCEVDLGIAYQIHNVCYVCMALCPGCGKDTHVRVMFNSEMTHFQHREVGLLTLEDRGSTGSVYITYPYPGDLGGS